MQFQDKLLLETSRRVELKNITGEVERIVEKARIKNGLVNIFTTHTTTAIIVNEGEKGLLRDIEELLQALIPEGEGYMHDRIDKNADSHLRAIFLGASLTIPVENSLLTLGSWQSIFFVELDGPRERTIRVSIVGES